MSYDFLKHSYSHKVGEARKKDIADLVKRWVRRNPEAATENMRYNKQARQELMDKQFGLMGGHSDSKAVGSNSGTRLTASVHPELISYIQAFYPDFLDTKEELIWFRKTFKGFSIPEKV